MDFLNAREVQALLQVGESKAYEIIRTLNAELQARGYLTNRGKVPKKYLCERYGIGAGYGEKEV